MSSRTPLHSPRLFYIAVPLVAALLSFVIAYTVIRDKAASSPSVPAVTATKLDADRQTPPGMVWIASGTFMMGTRGTGAPANEQPAQLVQIDGFWIDAHEVTNAEFARFVEQTGYITTAERAVDWNTMKSQLPPGTPKPPEDLLVPGSLVFMPPEERVSLDDPRGWWRWVPGASWRHPEGPGSSIETRANHPVVQVSYKDAAAYAKWTGKRLPTEAEWESAARGGLKQKRFSWGDTPPTESSAPLANIWQGDFPYQNTVADNYQRTAPVGSFPPNDYGLYDTAGNVWEWCADWYRADELRRRAIEIPDGELCRNPTGPRHSWNPAEPLSPSRVTKGGSFLCHESYCESYRPAARRGTAVDTGMSHLGFRCAKDAK